MSDKDNEIMELKSEKSVDTPKVWLTVFTPTYNRAYTLSRCYEAVCALKVPKDNDGNSVGVEWLIVDDGSTDNTTETVKQWIADNRIPIRYFKQRNQGKHVAMNLAVKESNGEFLVCLDSDDSFLPEAEEVWYKAWNNLTPEQQDQCKGITARCIDENGNLIGTMLPSSPFITSFQDLRFRYKVKGEMVGCNRVSVLRQFPVPVYESSLRFCPEAILWLEIGKKYKECIVETPARVYYQNSPDALTKGNSVRRAKENYYLWRYMVNNCVRDYFKYSPKEMLKPLVGMSRDGIVSGRSVGQVLADCDSSLNKVAVFVLYPLGAILSWFKK